jgi:hypothetical protein
VAFGAVKSTVLVDTADQVESDYLISEQEEKMLERLGLVLLACVLAFAFAPYFYALGGF